MKVSFTVPMKATPQGSMVPMRNPRTGKIRLKSDNPALAAFRELVGFECRRVIGEPWGKHRPLRVFLRFYFVRPQSVATIDRPFPVVKPDLDKLQRAVFDALSGVAYHDDEQIVQVYARKDYGPTAYCHIDIEDVETEPQRTIKARGSRP